MSNPESTPSHKTNERTRGTYTHETQMFERLCEKERCMGKPESTPIHKTNEPTRGRLAHTRHESSNAFVERRDRWASPNKPLVIVRTKRELGKVIEERYKEITRRGMK